MGRGGNGAYGQRHPHPPGSQDSEGLTCRDTKGAPSFGGKRLRGDPKTGPPPAAQPLGRLFIKDRKPFLLSTLPGLGGRAEVFRVSQKRFKEHKTRSRLGGHN